MSRSSSQEFGSTTTSSSQSVDLKMSRKPVIYPEFLSGDSYTTDNFWLKILQNASVGKFPRQVTYKSGVLYFRPKGKTVISKTLSSNPERCCKEFIDFLRSEAGMISDNDNEYSRQLSLLSSQLSTNQVEISWGKMREKTRQSLIERFVDKQTKTNGLDSSQKDYLYKVIKNGILLQVLTNDCFFLRNGEIEAISRLYFNPMNKSYFLDNEVMSNNIPKLTSYCSVRDDENVSRRSVTRNNIELLYSYIVKERLNKTFVS